MDADSKPTSTTAASDLDQPRLSVLFKLLYGSGDGGRASFNTFRQIFYAIFLTDVVGIDPRLASIAALVSIIWDAINDPIVGSLSDNVRTRWGRRRPFFTHLCHPLCPCFCFALVGASLAIPIRPRPACYDCLHGKRHHSDPHHSALSGPDA